MYLCEFKGGREIADDVWESLSDWCIAATHALMQLCICVGKAVAEATIDAYRNNLRKLTATRDI
jgi:hypothetical protein